MSEPIVPLDRRAGDLPVPSMIAGLAPVVLVFVSLAAGHTWLRGEHLTTGWALLYVVPMVLLGAVAALRLGTRLLAWWTWLAYPGALLGGAALLEVTEAFAPVTLAVGLVLLLVALRAPMPAPAPEVVATSVLHESPTGPPPTAGTVGAPPRALGAATGAPTVRLRLLTPSMLALMLGAALFCLAVGLLVGYAGFLDETQVEGGATAVWIARGIGAVTTLFGLFLLSATVRSRRDTVVIDADGLRRTDGAIEWSIAWPEVRSVAVGLRTKVIPDDLTPTPRRLRERRTVHLLLEPVQPAFGGRPELAPLEQADLPAPFTHVQALPDNTPWASRARLADTLAEALEAQVPDRYLVLEDRV